MLLFIPSDIWYFVQCYILKGCLIKFVPDFLFLSLAEQLLVWLLIKSYFLFRVVLSDFGLFVFFYCALYGVVFALFRVTTSKISLSHFYVVPLVKKNIFVGCNIYICEAYVIVNNLELFSRPLWIVNYNLHQKRFSYLGKPLIFPVDVVLLK